MALSPTAESRLIQWLLSAAGVTRPTTWFVAIHNGPSGPDGSTNEVSTANGYARQAATWTFASNVAANAGSLTFGPDATANWGTISAVSVWDSVTAGTCLFVGTVAAPTAYSIGDTATLAIGALTLTLN